MTILNSGVYFTDDSVAVNTYTTLCGSTFRWNVRLSVGLGYRRYDILRCRW